MKMIPGEIGGGMIARRIFLLGAAALLASASAIGADASSPSSDVWTRVNDDDLAVSYSSNVQAISSQDCFDGDIHYTNGVGEWCQFSFVGTGREMDRKQKCRSRRSGYLS
jgi:hypothetical protein